MGPTSPEEDKKDEQVEEPLKRQKLVVDFDEGSSSRGPSKASA